MRGYYHFTLLFKISPFYSMIRLKIHFSVPSKYATHEMSVMKGGSHAYNFSFFVSLFNETNKI